MDRRLNYKKYFCVEAIAKAMAKEIFGMQEYHNNLDIFRTSDSAKHYRNVDPNFWKNVARNVLLDENIEPDARTIRKYARTCYWMTKRDPGFNKVKKEFDTIVQETEKGKIY